MVERMASMALVGRASGLRWKYVWRRKAPPQGGWKRMGAQSTSSGGHGLPPRDGRGGPPAALLPVPRPPDPEALASRGRGRPGLPRAQLPQEEDDPHQQHHRKDDEQEQPPQIHLV